MRPNLSPEFGKRLALSLVVASLGGIAAKGSAAEAQPLPDGTPIAAEAGWPSDESNVESVFEVNSLELFDAQQNENNNQLDGDPHLALANKLFRKIKYQMGGIYIFTAPHGKTADGLPKSASIDTSPPVNDRSVPVEVLMAGQPGEWFAEDSPWLTYKGDVYAVNFDLASGQTTFANLTELKKEGALHMFRYGNSSHLKKLPYEDGPLHRVQYNPGTYKELVRGLNLKYQDRGGIKETSELPH